MNIVTVLVSWTYLLPTLWTEGSWESDDDIVNQVFNILVDVLPVVFSSVNLYLLTDTINYISDMWLAALIALGYLMLALAFAKLTEHPIYQFVSFDPNDWGSIVFPIVFPIAAVGLYIGNCLLT